MLFEIAIGDAYGAGFEFCDADKIRRHNHLDGYVPHELGIEAGCYTDDTQMSIAVAEVLLSSEEYTAARFADAFVACYRRDPRQGYAKRLQGLLDQCDQGSALLKRIHPESRRNGAVMRSVPLGLIPEKRAVSEAAKEQACVTHNTPEGILSSQVVAFSSHVLIYEKVPVEALPQRIRQETGFRLDLGWSSRVECDAVQTLHAVFTALCGNRSMSRLLQECVEFGGDVDSVAAIALGLASLAPDYSRDIPFNLVEGLESGAYGSKFLAELDARLAEKFPVLKSLHA